MEQLSVFASKSLKILNDAAIVSKMAHWNGRGPNFYEAHLLFGRVYKDLDGHIDGLVETLRAFGFSPDFPQFSGPGINLTEYDCQYLASLVLKYVMSLNSVLALFNEMCEREIEVGGDPRYIGLANRIQDISDTTLTDMFLLQAYLGS